MIPTQYRPATIPIRRVTGNANLRGFNETVRMKAFISYSHKDDVALERLHTHMAVLRREGQLDAWFDREILAGGDLDAEIVEQLESCGLFLLLVSPDFLASDYCVDREMERALERHHAGEAQVVPIIVEPCDWKSTPLRRLKALPRDGKPISEWMNDNNAYIDVVKELRRVLEADEMHLTTASEKLAARPRRLWPDTRRYRVKRDFDEIDRSDFREATFAVIRDYFERATGEIDAIEDLRGRFVSLSAVSFTCTIVNRARERGTAHITVHCRGGNIGLGDIYYSFTENALPNTANGGLMIKADEYELFLSSSMMGFGRPEERLTAEVAAGRLWEDFLGRAGVTCD